MLRKVKLTRVKEIAIPHFPQYQKQLLNKHLMNSRNRVYIKNGKK